MSETLSVRALRLPERLDLVLELLDSLCLMSEGFVLLRELELCILQLALHRSNLVLHPLCLRMNSERAVVGVVLLLERDAHVVLSAGFAEGLVHRLSRSVEDSDGLGRHVLRGRHRHLDRLELLAKVLELP